MVFPYWKPMLTVGIVLMVWVLVISSKCDQQGA